MVKGISDIKYCWRRFLWSKVLAVFLFLKVRVTKVIRKKGTSEVHPAEFQKDDLWEKNEFFKFKTILNIRRSSLVAIIWFEKRRKNHWRSWPLFRNGMLFITLTNSVQLKSAEICFGLTSFAN